MKRTCYLPALLLMAALLMLKPAFAQDRVYIFFESGSAKLDDAQLKTFDRIRAKYNLLEIDSIRLTGFADSLGNEKANLKLSEKRATAVAKYCERMLPPETPIIINARGENNKLIEGRDRRVEIALFFRSETVEATKKDTLVKGPPKPQCYYIDYTLLSNAHTRVITKRNKEYVLVEVPQVWFDKNNDHTATDDANGNMVLKKIRWTPKPMNGRRSRTSYQTQILKADFDKYSIFVPTDTPCRMCSTRFTEKGPTLRPDSCLWIDNLLTEHIQFMLPLKRTHVILRVPKEYVNINDKYYLEHDIKHRLRWETRRGRKNEPYYFTRIPMYDAWVVNNYFFKTISRKFQCCYDTIFLERRVDSTVLLCATRNDCNPGFTFIEVGDHYDPGFHNVYVGIGFHRYFSWVHNKPDRNYVAAVAGIDRKPGFYAAARYQYNYIITPILKLNPFFSWQQRSIEYPSKELRLYFGTALETNHTRTGRTRLEQQLHAGIAVISIYSGNRFFVQYGPAYDYLSKGNAYGMLQVGFNYMGW